MTHRHYGVPVAKPRPTYMGSPGAAAWSGGAFIGPIAIILIVLGVVLYGVNKIVTDAANGTTSGPRTTTEETSH